MNCPFIDTNEAQDIVLFFERSLQMAGFSIQVKVSSSGSRYYSVRHETIGRPIQIRFSDHKPHGFGGLGVYPMWNSVYGVLGHLWGLMRKEDKRRWKTT